VPEFDRLVARYLAEIYGKYRMVADEYACRLEQEIEQKVDVIFPPRYRQAYLSSKKYFQTYEKLKSFAQRSGQIASRKVSWNALMEEKREALKLDLYVGKR
jgi:translation initiation factor 2 alpha subunit (eIF-2alpha)